MNEITKRFVSTYKNMGLTGYRMGKDTRSITKQKISNIEKGITEVTAEILSEFSTVYQSVNANYILTGMGPMFNDIEHERGISDKLEDVNKDNLKVGLDANEQSKVINRISSIPGDVDIMAIYEKVIAEKDKEIFNLQAENYALKEQLEKMIKTA